MKKLWFKAKHYGWGLYLSSWEDWLILAAFILVLVLNFIRIDSHSHSASGTLINFIPKTTALTIILIVIYYLTGKKPK